MSDLTQFINSIPKITRIITISTLTTKFLTSLNIISLFTLICEWNSILRFKSQLWRLFTGFLITNPQPMQGLMDIYMLYSYSRGIETDKFFNNIADYTYYFIIILPIIWILNFFNNSWFLNQSLIGALTYTWSRSNKDQKVNIYFLPIKASLLPIVTLGFRMLLDGFQSFLSVFIGMISAYIYSCFESKSLGPLYYYFFPNQIVNNKNKNKVGTINSREFFNEGYLGAPNWLKKLLGTDPKRFQNKSNLNSRTNNNSNDKNEKKSFWSTSSFQGKGHRLGN